MLDRHAIFTAAHTIAKINKAYWNHESYRDLFSAALVEAYRQAKIVEAQMAEAQAKVESKRPELEREEAILADQLTVCTQLLCAAQDRNDYSSAEQYKLTRSDLQRRLREVRQEMETIATQRVRAAA